MVSFSKSSVHAFLLLHSAFPAVEQSCYRAGALFLSLSSFPNDLACGCMLRIHRTHAAVRSAIARIHVLSTIFIPSTGRSVLEPTPLFPSFLSLPRSPQSLPSLLRTCFSSLEPLFPLLSQPLPVSSLLLLLALACALVICCLLVFPLLPGLLV